MSSLKEIVSKNIINLRIKSKMTQLELGSALSYSDKAVSKWERGEAVPDAYVLLKLSGLFNVSVDYLLTEHDEKELKAAAAVHRQINHRVISLISVLGIWILAVIIFAVFLMSGSAQWLVFLYALPVTFIVLIVFTAVWGRRRTNMYYISLLVWSIICALYFTFLKYSLWFLPVIGIPAQIIVFLSFRIRIKPE